MIGGIPPLTVDCEPCGLRLIIVPLGTAWQLRVVTGVNSTSVSIRRYVHSTLDLALSAYRTNLLGIGIPKAEAAWEEVRMAFVLYGLGRPGLRPKCMPLREKLDATASHLAKLRLALASALHELDVFAESREIALNPVDIPEWIATMKRGIHARQTEDMLLEDQLDAITDALFRKA